eukprot:1157751_1
MATATSLIMPISAFNAIKKRCIEPKSKEDEEDHYRASERFFGGSFTDFILRFRVYILVLFVIIYGTLHLQANKGDQFTAGETDGLFGVNVDRRGTSKWDSEDYGVIEWDKDFDFSRIEEQEFIRDTCDDSKENHLSFSSETAVCVPDYVSLSDDSVSWQWADFAVKRAFISSAIQGVLIGMPLAFVILLISTRNWIISVFAVFDIIGIMLCELGLMAVLDWEFGISEAISTVMIIGFSVDYVVHLANAYLEAHDANTRAERLRFALLTMGISVVSGAITTFSAGFFLIFPVIVFFSKMGVLMMSTIAFSILFAMFFFTSLLAQFGPEYDTGKLSCCCWWTKKQQDQVDVNKIELE